MSAKGFGYDSMDEDGRRSALQKRGGVRFSWCVFGALACIVTVTMTLNHVFVNKISRTHVKKPIFVVSAAQSAPEKRRELAR